MSARVPKGALLVFLGCEILGGIDAYPKYLQTCLAWQPGNPIKASGPTMGQANANDGSGGGCMINADDIPTGGFVAGSSYSIQVSASSEKVYKLHSSDGQCLGNEDATSYDGTSLKDATRTFSWVAPSSVDSVTFHALCAAGYGQIDAAEIVSVQKSTTVTTTSTRTYTGDTTTHTRSTVTTSTASTITDTATTATVTTTTKIASVLLQVGTMEGIPLGTTGMMLAFKPIGEDSIELKVTLAGNSWIGLGINSGNGVSMFGGGDGSDVVTCTSSGVTRYWVQAYGLSGGTDMPGATCTQESGVTTLKFTRKLAASGSGRRLSEMAITPGEKQGIIFARGDEGVFSQNKHSSSMRGGQDLDFATGEITIAPKRSVEAVLIIHFALMCVAWGAFLPLGAVVSKRFREIIPDTWMKRHIGLQISGWFLQLLGMLMAILYCEEHSSHFGNSHTWIGLAVVTLGTLQPLNGFLRPHKPEEGQEKKMPRKVWEWMHKGIGWTILFCSWVNIVLGCLLLESKNYDMTGIVCAGVFAFICVNVPLLAVVYSFIQGRSKKGGGTSTSSSA